MAATTGSPWSIATIAPRCRKDGAQAVLNSTS
jgi:hypothetical protein